MAARASWKGFVKLSLVSVPVKAFTANNTSAEVRLNQLHSECNARVRYSKQCPEHGELAADEIVSGYEYGKGQYVVIDPEELAKLRSVSDKAIAIEGFIPPEEIDAVYHAGKNYYLLPDGVAGSKPYALLYRGMVDGGVCALARVVISSREQLALLRPVDGMLVMTIVNYKEKVKASDEFKGELVPEKVSKEELALARTLIDASRIKEFDYGAYRDRYVDQLNELIELKVAGKEVVQAPDLEEPRIINLMEALKKSVAQAQAASGGGKKMAPSAGARGKAPAAKKKSG